jgi:putative NADH-flavin reductase
MNILVVSVSQGTGAFCVKSALIRGHSASAFSRTPAQLDVTHPSLTKIAGDFHDADSVRGAVAGHAAVIICAAPKSRGIKDESDYFSRRTKYRIETMKEHGVTPRCPQRVRRRRQRILGEAMAVATGQLADGIAAAAVVMIPSSFP